MAADPSSTHSVPLRGASVYVKSSAFAKASAYATATADKMADRPTWIAPGPLGLGVDLGGIDLQIKKEIEAALRTIGGMRKCISGGLNMQLKRGQISSA